jgi:hypothetical protein
MLNDFYEPNWGISIELLLRRTLVRFVLCSTIFAFVFCRLPFAVCRLTSDVSRLTTHDIEILKFLNIEILK